MDCSALFRLLVCLPFATSAHLHTTFHLLAIANLAFYPAALSLTRRAQPHLLANAARFAEERNTTAALHRFHETTEPAVRSAKYIVTDAYAAGATPMHPAALIRPSGTEFIRSGSPRPTSASTLPAPSPALPPSSSLVNFSQIVESAGQFETFLSLLTATNVADLFQSKANKTTTGICIFAPSDKAFSTLPSGLISKLTAQQKISLCEFHALSAFYPLSALQQATAPFTPTLATDNSAAGKFTVNISNQRGTVVISTGLTNAELISTLYNAVPCGVFAINQVLLPEDIFGGVAPSQSPPLFPSVASSPLPSGFFPSIATAGPSPVASDSPSPPAIRQLLSLLLVVCGWKAFLL